MQDLPAQEPRRGHEQHAQATVGRSAPPHRSAHRPPRDNTCRRGVCGRRDRTRRRGSREDSAHLGPRRMTTDQFMWLLARVCGLTSYASLAIALLTGIALRTAVLDWLGSNRAVRMLHEFTIVLWIPLAALHVMSLLLDTTARIGPVDVVVPFHSTYGTLAIGFGALSLDVLIAVTVTAYL